MARRKNKKFIDPRYFMDEKTDIIKEAAYEPGDHFANVDFEPNEFGQFPDERGDIAPSVSEKEAMEDLADKFNVQVTFAKTIDGADIAVVTFEDGETIAYIDEDEMYRDLARRSETA